MSRLEHAALKRQDKRSWDHESAEYKDLERIISSLIQRYNVLAKNLSSKNEEGSNRLSIDDTEESRSFGDITDRM